MPHSYGYRARTRFLFARGHRKHGMPATRTYLRTYRVGDIVDIKGNGAIHKGMPHKYYVGNTGRVWNVTPRAVGVIVDKKVRGRYVRKKIHVRVEHVEPSKCRDAFVKRVQESDKLKYEASKTGQHVSTKRVPEGPAKGKTVRGKGVKLEYISAVPYKFLV